MGCGVAFVGSIKVGLESEHSGSIEAKNRSKGLSSDYGAVLREGIGSEHGLHRKQSMNPQRVVELLWSRRGWWGHLDGRTA